MERASAGESGLPARLPHLPVRRWRSRTVPRDIAGRLSGALRQALRRGVAQAFGRMVAENGTAADAIGAIGLGLGYRARGTMLEDPETGEPVNEETILRRAVGDSSLAGALIYLNDRARMPLSEIAEWLEAMGL